MGKSGWLLRRYPGIKNFVKIDLSSKVFEILAFLCFTIFVENSKWPPLLAKQKAFENRDGYSTEIPCGLKISTKSLNLARFWKYKHFCVLQILQKIQNGHHFWQNKFFLENPDGYSAEIPCGSKVSLKSLDLARFSRYKHFCVLQIFGLFCVPQLFTPTTML